MMGNWPAMLHGVSFGDGTAGYVECAGDACPYCHWEVERQARDRAWIERELGDVPMRQPGEGVRAPSGQCYAGTTDRTLI